MRTFAFQLTSLIVAAGMVMTPVFAADGGTMTSNTQSAKAAQVTPPDVVVQQTINTLLKRMDGHRQELRNHPAKLYQLVDEVLVPIIDVDFMAKLALGRPWLKASDKQRKRFIRAFQVMLVRTYGNALLEFNKNTLEFQPLRAKPGADDVTIRATVNTKSGAKVPVTLDMHLVDGHWKAYNGSVGSLSIVNNYRGQFRQAVQHGGVEKLVERLEQRYNLTDNPPPAGNDKP